MVARRRLLAALTATVVTAALALVWTAAPAHADEAWETALTNLMSRTAFPTTPGHFDTPSCTD